MLRGGRNRQDSGLKVTGCICFHLGTQKAESRMTLGGRGMKELSTVSGEWGVEPDQSEGAKGQQGGDQGRSTVTGCSRHLDAQPRCPFMEVLIVAAPGGAVSATEITSTAKSQLYGSDPHPVTGPWEKKGRTALKAFPAPEPLLSWGLHGSWPFSFAHSCFLLSVQTILSELAFWSPTCNRCEEGRSCA